MKRIFAVFFTVLIMISLIACNHTEINESSEVSKEITKKIIDFNAQYIRTNGYHEEIEYPIVKIIRSKEELDKYYNVYKYSYFLESRKPMYHDETIGFLDAAKEYNDAYFENKILVMVLLEEGSGSIRHKVDSIEYSSDGKMNINILRIIPEIGTDDMAEWHILIEPEMNTEILNESDIFVNLSAAYEEKEERAICDIPAAKPVIYFYPQKETFVSVKLNIDGKLTCTYPKYKNGWNVTAYPDGTITDENGQKYNYLYWEAETSTQYDFSKGFCIKGEDTAEFLEKALSSLGLNRKEANEFIVYWLPLMEENPYNIISFQTDIYEETAKLEITPKPDTVIRVFMAWKKADEFLEIPKQELLKPERNGFTVVEWGGSEVK